mgnify:CR=1 FL=1
MLTPDEMSDIRRHLGYHAIAVNRQSIGSVGAVRNYQMNSGLAAVESRLQELDAVDEAKLTGACIGLITIIGRDPLSAESYSVIINSDELVSPVTITIIAAPGETRFTLASKLASLAAQNVTLATARIQPAGPFEGFAVISANANPHIEFKAKSPFVLAVGYTGQAALVVSQQGDHVEPSAVIGESLGVQTVRYGFIPILNHLSSAIAGVTRNADVAKAGGYTRGFELKERKEILNFWRAELRKFLGLADNRNGNSGFEL